MKREQIIAELENLAEKLGVTIRYERMGTLQGGLCTIDDKMFLFINKSLTAESKIELIISEIKNLDYDDHFIKPEIRELLEG